jgi:hypothetical protein
MRVKAVRLGFYDHQRRRPGEVFEFAGAGEKLPSWLEKAKAPALDESEPEVPKKERRQRGVEG